MAESYTIEETEITYIIYAIDADDKGPSKGRDDDTDLAVQKDTVRIQEHVKNPG